MNFITSHYHYQFYTVLVIVFTGQPYTFYFQDGFIVTIWGAMRHFTDFSQWHCAMEILICYHYHVWMLYLTDYANWQEGEVHTSFSVYIFEHGVIYIWLIDITSWLPAWCCKSLVFHCVSDQVVVWQWCFIVSDLVVVWQGCFIVCQTW